MRNRNLWTLAALAVLLAAPPAWAQAGETWTTEIGGDAETVATELTLQLKPDGADVIYFEPDAGGWPVPSAAMAVGGSCGSVVFETFGSAAIKVHTCGSRACTYIQGVAILTVGSNARATSSFSLSHFVIWVDASGGVVKATCSPGSSSP